MQREKGKVTLTFISILMKTAAETKRLEKRKKRMPLRPVNPRIPHAQPATIDMKLRLQS